MSIRPASGTKIVSEGAFGTTTAGAAAEAEDIDIATAVRSSMGSILSGS